MSKYVVKQSMNLKGEVLISGSKNAALPIIVATILAQGSSVLNDIPILGDTLQICRIIESLGGKVSWQGNRLDINCDGIKKYDAPYEMTSKLRASFLVMGALLARKGKARISLPGGCPIGSRPLDLHLKGLSALGAKVTNGAGYVEATARTLVGTRIYLDFPSVGATENILMAACLAKGQTVIENVATEPEIVDLASFLSACGAKITGAGTDTIKINGVDKLEACSHTIIPDRIEAGTFMVATAMTHGKVKLKNVVPNHLKPLTAKLREMGVDITESNDEILVNAQSKLGSSTLKTLPFPGFPTDMQAPLCALMSVTDGTSIVTETVFENRFMHIGELRRMGAEIRVEGHTAIIEGVRQLQGAAVSATDLRAGAALTLAGLVASHSTEIDNIEHVTRGYENFHEKLGKLGASVELQD